MKRLLLSAVAAALAMPASVAAAPTHRDISYDIDSPPPVAAHNGLDVYEPGGFEGGRVRKRVRAKDRRKRVRFRFGSKLPGATFECRLDAPRYRPCKSPKVYRVKARRHRFKVRALNGTLKGESDSVRFRVVEAAS